MVHGGIWTDFNKEFKFEFAKILVLWTQSFLKIPSMKQYLKLQQVAWT